MFPESDRPRVRLHSFNRPLAIKPNTGAAVLRQCHAVDCNPRRKSFRLILGYIFYGLWLQTSHATKLNKPFVGPFTCVLCNPFANNFLLSTDWFPCSHKIKHGDLKNLLPKRLKLICHPSAAHRLLCIQRDTVNQSQMLTSRFETRWSDNHTST